MALMRLLDAKDKPPATLPRASFFRARRPFAGARLAGESAARGLSKFMAGRGGDRL
jgi:hypothetical protein